MDFLYEPWPWYVSGPLIACIMFLLILLGKNFGMSSNLRTMCTLCGAGNISDFFKLDWKTHKWNLVVALGTVIGGFIGAHLLSNDVAVAIQPETVLELQALGFKDAGAAYMPTLFFGTASLDNLGSVVILIVGGILVGFGARYAGGCTSGHAISGLSNLQLPSLIAVIGFFIGGLVMVHFIFPLLF